MSEPIKVRNTWYSVKRLRPDGKWTTHLPYVSLDLQSAKDDAESLRLDGFKAKIFKVTEIQEEIEE